MGGSPPILSLFGFSEMSDNCRPPLRMVFTSLMTLKVKNKTWISNFQVHMQAETNLPFKFMFKISSSASTEKSCKLFLNVENCSKLRQDPPPP